MTSNIEIRVKQALSEVEEYCSIETLDAIKDYIRELEDEVEYLMDSIESTSRKRRRRPDDDDWN